MAFLVPLGDDELTPEAAAVAREFLATHPGPLTNLDRTVLSSSSVFASYTSWFRVRDELVPFLGERAVTLFCFAISDGYGAAYLSGVFRRELEQNGDDPATPNVTEAERLLIDWGRAIGAGAASVPAELTARVEHTFQPRLRLLLTAFAGLILASAAFSVIAQTPPDES